MFIAPFPPPVGGAAKNTKIIADALEERGLEVIKLNTASPALHARDVAYHLKRVQRFLQNVAFMLAADRRVRGGIRTYYVVPDGGLGLFYTLAYILIIVSQGKKVIFHHRTYKYIYSYSFLMAAIVKLTARVGAHVFLSDQMASGFRVRYRNPQLDHVVVGNSATADVVSESPDTSRADGSLTVGFISNLADEKGFDVVCEVFNSLAGLSADYRFRLAGEPTAAVERARLAELRRTLGPRLDYRGAVHGAAKREFYSGLDILLFPTRFAQEAQPNVIFEAMACGCFVIATRRGCIPEMLDSVPSVLVEDGPRAGSVMIDAIRRLTRGHVAEHRDAIVSQFRAIRARDVIAYEALLELLSR